MRRMTVGSSSLSVISPASALRAPTAVMRAIWHVLPVFVLSAEREDLRGQHRLLTLGRVRCYGCEEGLTWVGVGWWAGCMAGVAGFVGRKRELAFLRAALGGDTRMVLVVGDAGVGKTRFAEEGVRRAAAGGMAPVWEDACRWPKSCRCCRWRGRWVS